MSSGCCCPPAVTALLCLWVKSGFSKGSVAGALTFFPPEPALYKFQRYTSDGQLLPDEPELEEEEENTTKGDADKDTTSSDDHLSGPTQPLSPKKSSNTTDRLEDSYDGMDERSKRSGMKPNEQKQQSPAKMLTEQAARLKKKGLIRNKRDARDVEQGIKYNFMPDPRLTTPPSFRGSVQAVKIGPHRRTKNFCAALIYRVPPDWITPQTKTIIYSHGNATDIGAMNFMQAILARGLHCNVVMYDYSGYGASGGVALEANTYRDITMVYEYVVENVSQGQEERNVIVYGQSVGSGPSCYICARRPDVGGLVLHSPFMSGMRVLTPSRALACLDIFPNIDRIRKVHCPVFIIHGALDEEVDITHGKALYNAVPEDCRYEPWWVPDRGHNDITEGRSKVKEYLEKMKAFIESLD